MKTVIVSANPLFGEVIRETIQESLCNEVIELGQYRGPAGLDGLNPDVVILDESMPGEIKDGLLAAAYHLPRCRIVIINLFNNDFTVLDSTRSVFQDVIDLKRVMIPGLLQSNRLAAEAEPSGKPRSPIGGKDEMMRNQRRASGPSEYPGSMAEINLRPGKSDTEKNSQEA